MRRPSGFYVEARPTPQSSFGLLAFRGGVKAGESTQKKHGTGAGARPVRYRGCDTGGEFFVCFRESFVSGDAEDDEVEKRKDGFARACSKANAVFMFLPAPAGLPHHRFSCFGRRPVSRSNLRFKSKRRRLQPRGRAADEVTVRTDGDHVRQLAASRQVTRLNPSI